MELLLSLLCYVGLILAGAAAVMAIAGLGFLAAYLMGPGDAKAAPAPTPPQYRLTFDLDELNRKFGVPSFDAEGKVYYG